MHATHYTNLGPGPETWTLEDIEKHMARAEQMRSQAMTDLLRAAGRKTGRGLRAAHRLIQSRLRLWASERSLALLSDRSLADMGIPRWAIPLVVRGIDWRTVDPEQPAWRQRLQPLTARLAAHREQVARRRRILRELETYSDHDLDDLGIFRPDIPRLARAAAA